MTGKFKILYGFDVEYDEDKPYQARCDLNDDQIIESWASSFGEARQNLITILQSIPDQEEIDL